MRKRTGRHVTSFIILMLCGMLALLQTTAQAAERQPEFALPSVVGDETISLQDFRGKVLLINFWATWCPPCRKEIPSLISLQKEYASKGFSVIGLSMDQGGKKQVAKFVKKAGMNYPVAIADKKAAREFGGVIGIPASFLLDRSGKVAKEYPGYVTHEVLEKDIKDLLAD